MHGEGRKSFPILLGSGEAMAAARGRRWRQGSALRASRWQIDWSSGPHERHQSLTTQALADVAAAQSPDVLEQLRVALLGKSGSITSQLKQLGALPADERKAAGEAINQARDALTRALGERKALLEDAALDARLAAEAIDITLPGRNGDRAGLHPITRTLERITGIFGRLGYELSEGPEIEDDWHNFEALNFPPHHPARAMHDTFYFGDGRLLRTPPACRCATWATTRRHCA